MPQGHGHAVGCWQYARHRHLNVGAPTDVSRSPNDAPTVLSADDQAMHIGSGNQEFPFGVAAVVIRNVGYFR